MQNMGFNTRTVNFSLDRTSRYKKGFRCQNDIVLGNLIITTCLVLVNIDSENYFVLLP